MRLTEQPCSNNAICHRGLAFTYYLHVRRGTKTRYTSPTSPCVSDATFLPLSQFTLFKCSIQAYISSFGLHLVKGGVRFGHRDLILRRNPLVTVICNSVQKVYCNIFVHLFVVRSVYVIWFAFSFSDCEHFMILWILMKKNWETSVEFVILKIFYEI